MSGESTKKFHFSAECMASVELAYDQATYFSETLKSSSAPEGAQDIALARSQRVLAN